MKLIWRLCCAMPVSRRESGASRFWSLQTRLKGNRAIPAGCAPEPEPAPFVDVGLPFFAVDDGDKFPPGDDEFRDSWQSYPRARRRSTRVHRGKCMALRVSKCSDRRCLGHCHCMRLGRRRFGWGCPFGSHRRGFACRMNRTRPRRVSRLGGGR
jgi:hypothetical protein